MVPRPTARRPLMASLVAGLGMGLLVASALVPSDTRAALRAESRGAKDGGTLLIGTTGFDYIDPALIVDPTSTSAPSVALAAWAVEDASCALLLHYPIGPPTVQNYSLEPEVATGYPTVSRDGRTYTFTIRKG